MTQRQPTARRPKASGPRPTRHQGGRDGAHPGPGAALCCAFGCAPDRQGNSEATP
jgi:hypothetical protein